MWFMSSWLNNIKHSYFRYPWAEYYYKGVLLLSQEHDGIREGSVMFGRRLHMYHPGVYAVGGKIFRCSSRLCNGRKILAQSSGMPGSRAKIRKGSDASTSHDRRRVFPGRKIRKCPVGILSGRAKAAAGSEMSLQGRKILVGYQGICFRRR